MDTTRLDLAQAKARVLSEALPYIRRWSGKTMVIKIGGETLEDQTHLESFVRDVILLRFVGVNPVIVHGGGPQITRAMKEAGMEPVFSDGKRVTDEATMKVVKRVLLDDINKTLTSAINEGGGRSTGLSGESGSLFSVQKAKGPNGEELGFVGEITSVNPEILSGLLESGFIPVVAPVGAGADGTYNINADMAAGALAPALVAQKIVFLTNVPGLYRSLGDEGSLISQLSAQQCRGLLEGDALSEGMRPKIGSVVTAIEGGVPQAHILDGRVLHALLLEIFTDEGVGTMVMP